MKNRMKNKIKYRLFLYFAASLMVFSAIMALVFTSLFSRYNMDLHKKDLEIRATTIASSLSSLSTRSSGGMHGMGMGMGHMSYNAYLQFIDDIALTDVWVVDPNLDLIVRGHGQSGLAYASLPENAEKVIQDALGGKTSFSENFSSLLDSPSVTVATPLVSSSGNIAGAVLLHTEISNIASISSRGLQMLFLSMLVAIIISFAIAGLLSSRFTRPLESMKQTAAQISGGNFDAKTNIQQEDEIGDLAKVMDLMALELAEASKQSMKLDQLRQDFVANISHELLTPVTVLRGSLEALRDGVVSDETLVREYYQQMLGESIHLERLVRDLLDLSKLQNPDFVIEKMPLQIQDVVEDAVRSIRRIADTKHVAVNLAKGDGNLILDGDYGRLRQMFLIVLHNAVKFSPEAASVDVEIYEQEGKIRIADQGPGIAQEELDHIFDRFYRQRSEENKTGSGLGLSIAKQIADRHGIEIEIQSPAGGGTVVDFLF